MQRISYFLKQGKVILNLRGFSQSASEDVRVRFAPSPTGDLHLGGLRTALYNYLFAKQHGGKFILRCEDTDQVRLVPGALDRMIALLSWVGIKTDEGPKSGGSYGPYIQSERLDLYNKWVNHLLSEGRAYRCFCSSQRLELLRKEQARRREVFQGYDNLCRSLTDSKIDEKLSSHTPHVIRFKLAEGEVRWKDLVYGEISTDLMGVEGDPIIMKSDEYPTYHFANVIDDHFMKITHVLRGAEWQSSTPKHLQIFSAFNWKPPSYAHLPLLLNPNGTKLSKRQDSLRVQYLKDQGFEADSLISLLCLAGGGVSISHSDINESGVTLDEAVSKFSLDNVRTQNSVLALDRLADLNRAVIKYKYKTENKDMFIYRLYQVLLNHNIEITAAVEDIMENLYKDFQQYSDRMDTLQSIVSGELSFLWHHPTRSGLTAADLCKRLLNVKGVPKEKCLVVLNAVKHTAESNILLTDEILMDLQKRCSMSKPAFYKVLRVVLSGNETGPPVLMMAGLLGCKQMADRCDLFINALQISKEDISVKI